MDFRDSFISKMINFGFTLKGELIADNKWHDCIAHDGKKKGTYSITIGDNGKYTGVFFDRRDPDNKHGWPCKDFNCGDDGSTKALTRKEREELERRIEAKKKENDAIEARRQERLSRLLTAYYNGGKPFHKLAKATADHPYLKRKGIQPHGIKLRKKNNELIMPCYQPDSKVWTMQRILPNGKKFLIGGGKKKGSYFPFVKAGEDMSVILVCEGYSTGASIREATNLPTAAAIDAGNIKYVLRNLKKKFPNSRFIICADNDEFTRNAKKELWNVGIEKAKAAAVDIGGASVIWPTFTGNTEEKKLSDFNDLHHEQGLQAVADTIMPIVNTNPATQSAGEAAVEDEPQPASSDQHLDGGDHIPYGDYPPPDQEERDYSNFEPIVIKQGDFNMNFKCLGIDNGLYFYFSYLERRIVALTAQGHTLQNLLQLDTLEAWEQSTFGVAAKSEKKIALYAFNAMKEMCARRGIFKQADNVRGGGAWLDKDRVVVNAGDRLFVDGKQLSFDEFASENTYIASAKFMRPSPKALTSQEAVALRKICEMVTWVNPLSGSLLAGWLVIAPVCGALGYRPHIWIEGEHESGKSTVINKIIRRTLGRTSLNYEGGTSEARIRQQMSYDARPLVYDEAEGTQTMEAVIELARGASTGAIVGKFGQADVRIRFAACFSSINPPINKAADESRISFLKLKKNRKASAITDFERLIEMIEEHLTPEFGDRLLSRTVMNLAVLFENIKTFQAAARRVINGARASEQIGTMLAGLYLLHSTQAITPEKAEEWVKRYEWRDHTSIDKDSDPVRMVQHLSGAIIRYSAGSSMKELSVGEMIVAASKDKGSYEDKALRMYGMKVEDDRLYIANTGQNLSKLFSGTDWAKRWGSGLLRVDGALEHKSAYFAPAIKTSATSIPLDLFTDTYQTEIAF